jgi:hypothetical protein
MARKVRTKKGRVVYARRKAIVEPLFGQIDTVKTAGNYSCAANRLRGVNGPSKCAIHNLLKLTATSNSGSSAPYSSPTAARSPPGAAAGIP